MLIGGRYLNEYVHLAEGYFKLSFLILHNYHISSILQTTIRVNADFWTYFEAEIDCIDAIFRARIPNTRSSMYTPEVYESRREQGQVVFIVS